MIGPILEGEQLVLTELDEETDAEIISRWTHDMEYLIATADEPVRPLSTNQVKKQLQEWAKKKETRFPYAARTRQDSRLVGLAMLRWVDWPHGSGLVGVFPGAPFGENLVFAGEALELITRFAFQELNLFRLSTQIAGYNQRMLDLYQAAGYQIEVRRREARLRFGQRWDMIHVGLQAEEWRTRQAAKGGAE